MQFYLSQQFSTKCAIDFTRPLLLAISGGADSLSLLDAAHRLGLKLVVAHFNHQLRPQAAAEQAQVAGECEVRGLRFVGGAGDVRAYAAEQGLSIEQAARSLRYRFLFAQAELLAAQAVVTAHHADDQVETLLLHLLRGSGLDGLRGMLPYTLPNAWSSRIPLLRPLLEVPKSTLVAYCGEHGLQPVQDETNQDVQYFRNRLRLELMPVLESASPGLRPALLRLTDLAQADVALLEQLVDQVWPTCFKTAAEGCLAFDLPALLAQPLALQRRLLRRGLGQLRPGLADLGFEVLERAVAFLPAAAAQTDLAAGLYLRREGQTLWLARWEADLPGNDWPQWRAEELALSAPAAPALGQGWRLTIELQPAAAAVFEQAQQNADPYQAWLDAEQAGERLWLRTRRAGERFQRLGLGGRSQKLSDLMINARLPQRARAHWPLVANDQQGLWVPGLAAGHAARLTAATQRVYHLRLERAETL